MQICLTITDKEKGREGREGRRKKERKEDGREEREREEGKSYRENVLWFKACIWWVHVTTLNSSESSVICFLHFSSSHMGAQGLPLAWALGCIMDSFAPGGPDLQPVRGGQES